MLHSQIFNTAPTWEGHLRVHCLDRGLPQLGEAKREASLWVALNADRAAAVQGRR